MESIANHTDVLHLAIFLKEAIPRHTHESPGRGAWTNAVHCALREFANQRKWDLYPTDRPYKGEFLLDFMVIDKPYGIRVACEAEWWPEYPNRTPEHQLSELEKDFEKLTAVKGDIKLFIFEGDEADLGQLASKYLSGNAQIINKEAFLAMRWTKDNHFVCHWWKPEVNTTVTFEKLT